MMTATTPMLTSPLIRVSPRLPFEGLASPPPEVLKPRTARTLKVAIASFDFVGPVRNGGVGTASTSLAEALAAAGHQVTCLYLGGQWCENGTLEHWIEHYKTKGVEFVPIPPPEGLRLEGTWQQNRAYEAFLWLRQRQFDVIHFSEWKGPGYFCLAAKRQGLAFEKTTLCVHAHGPTLWHKLNNAEDVNSIEDLETLYMERRSAEWADVLVSPSQYLLRWMADAGWSLKKSACFVQPYVQPKNPSAPSVRGENLPKPIQELVFFGRLEVRKGLVLFCDALDALKASPECRSMTVTFLGKSTEVGGLKSEAYLKQRAARWPWPVQIITDRDQAGALEYLQTGPRLAVIASLADNLPNTVLECLGAQVPFIASFVGGIPEMIHEDDWSRTCFSPKPLALAETLCRCLREGAAPSRPAVQPEENERAWVAWHANLLKDENGSPKAGSAPAAGQSGFKNRGGDSSSPMRRGDRKMRGNEVPPPLVSVCVAHRDRPGYLRQAIASLAAQDYKNLEIVVVDDASTRPEALAYLDTLEPALAKRGGKLVRLRENVFPGAARNRAAREARGEYLLFMDDDNFAKPNEVSLLMRVAQHTGAEIVSCFRDVFEGEQPPDPKPACTLRWMFLGDALSVGVFENYFGDTNSLVRRDRFLALGGFHENWGVGNEDWEFMARAVLAGCRLEVVPEALVWYRLNRNEPTVNRTTPPHLNRLQILKPYLAAMPPALSDLLLFAQGARLKLDTLSRLAHDLGTILREQGIILPEHTSPPGIIKRAVFRLLGRKMRRSIRKRIATVSRWLLDPQTQG